jgi:hypothetical protein
MRTDRGSTKEILSAIDIGGRRNEQSGTVADKLRSAVLDWSLDAYQEAFKRLSELWTERQYLERRQQLLSKLA